MLADAFEAGDIRSNPSAGVRLALNGTGQAEDEHVKAVVDCLFVMGINHVFYHGTPFSPADAAWPGWMFYAAGAYT